jgi:hypothetical protein
VKEERHAWLIAQPEMFLSEGVRKLVLIGAKFIEKQEDYVEKCC